MTNTAFDTENFCHCTNLQDSQIMGLAEEWRVSRAMGSVREPHGACPLCSLWSVQSHFWWTKRPWSSCLECWDRWWDFHPWLWCGSIIFCKCWGECSGGKWWKTCNRHMWGRSWSCPVTRLFKLCESFGWVWDRSIQQTL